jgi:hypothetical protein
MESTGEKNRIHISSDTAELLIAADKEGWIQKRKEMVDIKGKGSQRTYWVKVGTASSVSTGSVKNEEEDIDPTMFSAVVSEATVLSHMQNNLSDLKIARLVEWNVAVLTQRLQAILLYQNKTDEIDPVVVLQLKTHVEGIADMYRKNPFHNFEVSMRKVTLKWISGSFRNKHPQKLYASPKRVDPPSMLPMSQ